MTEPQGGPPPGWPTTAPVGPGHTQPGDGFVASFPPAEVAFPAVNGASAPLPVARSVVAPVVPPAVVAPVAPPAAALPMPASVTVEAEAPLANTMSAGHEVLPLPVAPLPQPIAPQATVVDPLPDPAPLPALAPLDLSPPRTVPVVRSAPRKSRLPIIAAVGAVLIAGTAGGAYAYDRHLKAKADSDAPATPLALPKKKKVTVEKTHAPTAQPTHTAADPAPPAPTPAPTTPDTSEPTPPPDPGPPPPPADPGAQPAPPPPRPGISPSGLNKLRRIPVPSH